MGWYYLIVGVAVSKKSEKMKKIRKKATKKLVAYKNLGRHGISSLTVHQCETIDGGGGEEDHLLLQTPSHGAEATGEPPAGGPAAAQARI